MRTSSVAVPTHWTFAAASGVRSAMSVTRLADGRHALVGGMVYVNSGYAAFGGRPGNVLLAFGVE